MNLRQWFALLFLFVLYLLLGGVVFVLFESPEEEIRSKELNHLKNVIYGLYFPLLHQNRYLIYICDIKRYLFTIHR